MTTNTDAVQRAEREEFEAAFERVFSEASNLRTDIFDLGANGEYCEPDTFIAYHLWREGLRDRAPEVQAEAARVDDALDSDALGDAARDVIAERQRQMSVEGWTPEHDDEHADRELALAAIVYTESAVGYHASCPDTWPWSPKWFKPTTPRRDLVKAAALILAEIERIDRVASSSVENEPK